MALNRSPFQGLSNVLRFNWHFYALALLGIALLAGSSTFLDDEWKNLPFYLIALILLPIVTSLIITYYIYDYSDLYAFNWCKKYATSPNLTILNINAGFDETSPLIASIFQDCPLYVCDFYDSGEHTEISIKRARKAYPPSPDTVKVKTNNLPFADGQFDLVFVTFAAHEIRNTAERKRFFLELNRVTKRTGKIFLTEHLRDPFNFLAYTIGFFHFYPRSVWIGVFKNSGLTLIKEHKTTKFITTFMLTPDGTTP